VLGCFAACVLPEIYRPYYKRRTSIIFLVLFSTLFQLPPLRFHAVSEDAGIEPDPEVPVLWKVAAILVMGSDHFLKREAIIVYRKEVTRVPLYKYRGFGVYSMNKSGRGGL
jgi:hypothetical protein